MPLTRDDLFSLEAYAQARPEFRARVIAHKRYRQVALGDHATLYFEDRLTIQYQVQEMLRVERIFEPEGIQDELDAYTPLIPDGGNWKATFMLEYTDVEERRLALQRLLGIEDRVWVRVGDLEPVFASADEDLERANETKTSAVHFLRFELGAERVAALKGGSGLTMGIDHPRYRAEVQVADATRVSLIGDLD